ncbi:UNVERIFIED_CONTAM: hypothetical protein Sradi_3550400 [Sesamum radiatum]|uniref:Uncharacterized protein n=1 Tax=Sesamum radiatum TaxID=300843 RepID=A0AAW2QFK0_SESRA
MIEICLSYALSPACVMCFLGCFQLIPSADQHTTSHDEFGVHDETVFPEDNDNFLEHILRKIELVHSRVHKLKAQLDDVMIKNAGKFSSSENLSQLVAGDVQTSSVRSPTFSACNGDTVSVGGLFTPSQHISDYDLGDFIMPDSAVSSFGEAIPIPDIIESTVGLLSSIDVTQHQAQVGDSSEKVRHQQCFVTTTLASFACTTILLACFTVLLVN